MYGKDSQGQQHDFSFSVRIQKKTVVTWQMFFK
jgi:hypothetical protein